jgi:DNA-binding transcriptional MerR regulator
MKLHSIGELSKIVGLEVHQVRYLCQKYQIKPFSQAGKKFIYNITSIEKLREVIAERSAALEEKVAKK